MRLVLDSSVLIDHLRDREPAKQRLAEALARGDELWSSYVVRAEVLAGMREDEVTKTQRLLGLIRWVGVDEAQADRAGEFGRQYGRSTPGIDIADLILAALTRHLDAELLTLNVRHFPMFPGLRPPY